MSTVTPSLPPAKKRIDAFDYLRGFFIVIIIIDHLWRWPNLFQFVSGRGELWVSAAEGFVIISGLLVGYIRGYKNRHHPLKEVSAKLIKRGLLLYIWMIITTVLLVAMSWAFQFKGNIAHIPIENGNWLGLFADVLRFDYVHTLTHFLYLYAIFLVISPAAVWLLRHGQAWLLGIISFALWVLGYAYHVEWLQWQVLFFVPAIAGYYLDTITSRFQQAGRSLRHTLQYGSMGIAGVMLAISAIMILPTEPGLFQHTLFSRDPLTFERVVLSFIWFIGLVSLFQTILPLLERYLGWLLRAFGGRSLTAYIVHIFPLMLCQLVIANTKNFVINTLLVIVCVLLTWAIIKIPHINKLIPR